MDNSTTNGPDTQPAAITAEADTLTRLSWGGLDRLGGRAAGRAAWAGARGLWAVQTAAMQICDAVDAEKARRAEVQG